MKNRFRKMKNILRSLIFVLAILFLPVVALADDKIDVEYPVGTNINGDDIFDEGNILPGWEETKTIRVENKSTTDDTNLYFTFDVRGSKDLSEELKLYVIRKADNNYRIGGSGDRWDLKSADEENLYVDKLSAGESERYKIRIKFDKDAGNEYQGKEAKFDINFEIESSVATEGLTEGEILAGEGRIVSGEPPEEEVAGVKTTNNENTGEIAGEENECQSWPRWVWILALIIFASIFGMEAYKNYKQGEYRWKFAISWTILAVVFWYFFDICREFVWFLYGVIIIAIVGHFVYLYYLRKKIKEPKIKESVSLD